MMRLLLAGLAPTVAIALALTFAVALVLILFRDNSFVDAYRSAAYVVGVVVLVFAAAGNWPALRVVHTPWRSFSTYSGHSGMRVNPSALMIGTALVLFGVAIALE